MDIKQIFENNQEWIAEKLKKNGECYFTDLAKGQSPSILYIGCADSRVTAESLMGAEPGDIFVTRNIANMVINTDLTTLSVVDYAVNHLEVSHAVVCGHYFCGGVKAAMQSADLGTLNPYLREIRDVFRLHQDELEAIEDEEARYKRLVELNVQEQCVNLIKMPEVQKAYNERGLQVHGWVFDISTGKLIDLEIDFDSILEKIMEIYRLA